MDSTQPQAVTPSPTPSYGTGTMSSSFTVSEVLRKGWEVTKQYWITYALFTAALLVIGMAITFLGGISQNAFWGILWQIVGLVFQVVAAVASIRLVLLAVDGKKIEPKDLVTTDWMLLLYVAGTYILYGIAVVGGLILFIVPGIILAIGFVFALYLAVEKKLNPLEAMTGSWRLAKGNMGTIFLFWLAVVGLYIAAFIVPAVVLMILAAAGGDAAGIIVVLLAILIAIPIVIFCFVLSMVSTFGLGYMYRRVLATRPEALKF